MKSYGVTIQMKPLWQHFCMESFVFQNLKIWDFSKILIFNTLWSKRINIKGSMNVEPQCKWYKQEIRQLTLVNFSKEMADHMR